MLKIAILIFFTTMANAGPEKGFTHHQFKDGEQLSYNYEDTDTILLPLIKDGTIQAGDAIKVQEISIPITIEISIKNKEMLRTLHILSSAKYHENKFNDIAKTPFIQLYKISKNIPESFSYTFKDDKDALDNLNKIYEVLRKDEHGDFLFYKMQDVHQMQGSVAIIPEGMAPGQTHFLPSREIQGVGGKFIAAPSRLIYQGIKIHNGIKSGYFKFISLGNEFITPSIPWMKTYTNFFYTMHVALEGPNQGLMLFGEGQETATVLKKLEKGGFEPMAIVQRQFSIAKQ